VEWDAIVEFAAGAGKMADHHLLAHVAGAERGGTVVAEFCKPIAIRLTQHLKLGGRVL
jgi:hypothetical protein